MLDPRARVRVGLINRLENRLSTAKRYAANNTGDEFELLSCADLDGGDFAVTSPVQTIREVYQRAERRESPSGILHGGPSSRRGTYVSRSQSCEE